MPACVQNPDPPPVPRPDSRGHLVTRADQQHRPATRSASIKARVTSDEARVIEKAAARCGLPVATFVRAAVLDSAALDGRLGPEEQRPLTPPHALVLGDADRARLADLRAAIGRTGGLANSLVRLAHRGFVHDAALGVAVRDLADVCRQLVALLGGSTR